MRPTIFRVARVTAIETILLAISSAAPASAQPAPEEATLGVHVTVDIAGQARFGPDSEYVEGVDYRFDESRRSQFIEAIRDWYPGLDETRLRPGFVHQHARDLGVHILERIELLT